MSSSPAPGAAGQGADAPTDRSASGACAKANRDDTPEPAWLAWPLGAKVVVRRRLAEGGYSDRVGELIEKSATEVVVRTRRFGDVRIGAEEIAIGKVVPPPRPRAPRTPPD